MASDPTDERREPEQRAKSRMTGVKGVLFDFDGTLTLPGHLDFAAIREAIGCPPDGSLLKYLDAIPDPRERARASEVLDRFEGEAADRSLEDPDAAAVVRFCHEHNLEMGIITRNSRASLNRSLARFTGIGEGDFGVIVTRDDPLEVKPSPEGIREACRRLGISVAETFVVGDFLYDIEAGERAGATTVFYDSDPERTFDRPQCDYSIDRLGELPFLLSLHLPLSAGKIPNEILAYFLSNIAASDGREHPGGGTGAQDTGTLPSPPYAGSANEAAVIVGPGVGEDVAAVALADALRGGRGAGDIADSAGASAGSARHHRGGPESQQTAVEDVLLLKSDPITFVAEGSGSYLVTVNANDIAAAGGTPRWLLATLLAPPGTLAVEIGEMFRDLAASCRRAGVALCGGHTEVTAAVTRPVVSGTMVGTVSAGGLVSKKEMRTGDAVLLTKGIAVEGTAILATHHRQLLVERGVDAQTIARGTALAGRMSILPEARISAHHEGIASMHDVTEGGVATALREIGVAGGHRLRIDLDRIPLLSETRAICGALGLDPLGLIGSGSLIICVRREHAESLLARLEEAAIPAARIGEVLEEGEGIEALSGGSAVSMPRFAVDELTRIA